MAAKWFLVILGAVYALLALWCLVRPTSTARAVGYELLPGSGQSEYMTVYGGLQLGLGLIFLSVLWWEPMVAPMLVVSTVIHSTIVLARLTSVMLYRGIQTTTYTLAVLEIIILIASAFFWWRHTGAAAAY